MQHAMIRPALLWVVTVALGASAAIPAIAGSAEDDGRAPVAAAVAAPTVHPVAEAAGRELFARFLVRTAGDLLRLPEPEPGDFEVALTLAEWATELAPDSADAWRALAQIAAASEGIDERVPQRLREALLAICRLDPQDEVARLQLLSTRIDEIPTAEGRVAAYRTLLSPENRRQLGGPVAARLALELALLLYRSGDVDGYAEALALAVALDPAFPAATEMAAGFFRHHADDPVAQAELYIAAALANPSNLTPLRTLATIALENGAYAGARRLLGILMQITPPDDRGADAVVADLAVALWGDEQVQEALTVLERRRRDVELLVREQARLQDPEMDALRLEAVQVPPAPRSMAIQAVALSGLGSPQAPEALGVAMAAFRLAADRASREAPGSGDSLRLTLDALNLLVWLNADPAPARALFREIQQRIRLPEPIQRRYEGWLTLREGDPQRAIELLEPLGDDPAAQLGVALSLEALDRRGDAARILLALYRGQPASTVGLWSRARLARTLGREVPPPERGVAIDALLATMPRSYDRLLLQRARAVALQLRVVESRVGPMSPVVLEAEVVNTTDLPLAIAATGPIQPNLALTATATVAQLDRPVALPPQVISLGRRLRLEPQQRLTVPVDLGLGPFGEVLDRTALAGSTVQARAILNPRPVPGGALQPGFLGDKAESPQMRVDGVRVSQGWIEDSLAAVRVPDSREDLVRMLLLAQVASATAGAEEGALPEEFAALREVWPSLTQAWAQLDPASRGFLLVTIPAAPSPGLNELLQIARGDEAAETRLGYLLARVRLLDDPVLLAALSGDDPRLAAVATLVRSRLERTAAAAAAVPTPARRP
jgi:tetratricopeptide (TPR) repeat protein